MLAGELIAFWDMFDAAYSLITELRQLFSTKLIPLSLLSENKSLFEVIHKRSRTSERGLMLDIACGQETFQKHDVFDIRLIRSSQNVAYALTKRMKQCGLRDAISGVLKFEPVQWMVLETITS